MRRAVALGQIVIAGGCAEKAYSSWRQYYIAYYLGRAIAFDETTEQHVDNLVHLLRQGVIDVPFK